MLERSPSGRGLVDAERRIHRLLRKEFTEALFEHGISFAQFEVMELLHDERQLHPGAIGRRLLITRQAAHRLVRHLERGDLVETWRLDGGSVGVGLTRAGQESLANCSAALHPTFDLIDRLEEERRTALLRLLTSWELALLPPALAWWRRLPP